MDISLRLNGQVLQKSNTRNMLFKAPALVSHISKVMTLEAGDIVATGTPSGMGHARTPPEYLRPGDVVEVEIERLGTLKNRVVEER